MSGWTVNLPAREARHRSGLVVRFTPADDGAFDGEAIAGFDGIRQDDVASAAKLMREAGEAFTEAIQEQRREALIAAGVLFGELWQRAMARALPVDHRLLRRWVAGDRPVPKWAVEKLRELAADHAKACQRVSEVLERVL